MAKWAENASGTGGTVLHGAKGGLELLEEARRLWRAEHHDLPYCGASPAANDAFRRAEEALDRLAAESRKLDARRGKLAMAEERRRDAQRWLDIAERHLDAQKRLLAAAVANAKRAAAATEASELALPTLRAEAEDLADGWRAQVAHDAEVQREAEALARAEAEAAARAKAEADAAEAQRQAAEAGKPRAPSEWELERAATLEAQRAAGREHRARETDKAK